MTNDRGFKQNVCVCVVYIASSVARRKLPLLSPCNLPHCGLKSRKEEPLSQMTRSVNNSWLNGQFIMRIVTFAIQRAQHLQHLIFFFFFNFLTLSYMPRCAPLLRVYKCDASLYFHSCACALSKALKISLSFCLRVKHQSILYMRFFYFFFS